MYGLFRIRLDQSMWRDMELICVSATVDNLIHHYNCMDRNETTGKKLWELQNKSDPHRFTRYMNFRALRKTRFVIDEVEEV